MLNNVQAIVLAAGKSSRFNTGNTKLIEKICGQEIILYPLAILDELSIPTTLVVGFQAHKIKKIVEKNYGQRISFVDQIDQNGTAGATRLTRKSWEKEYLLVMKADVPLLSTSAIEALYKKHIATDAAISFIASHNGDPSGFTYTRVVKQDNTIALRKQSDLTLDQLQEFCCVHSGIYLISKQFLLDHIDTIVKDKHTQEFHLSELVNIATKQKHKVSMLTVQFDQIRSVNNNQELWAAEQIKRSELIRYWMDRGVRFSAAQSVHMDLDVEIGAGSFIGCSVHLLSGTKIGANSTVNAFSLLENAIIGNNAIVHSHSILKDSSVGDYSHVGPFAHLRTGSTIGNHSTIGNFVETKNCQLADHSKAKHLSYLGDAKIGSHVNIGAGTITCNYDGKNKHTTEIKDRVFIGTNNSLVAPVIIGTESYTAAGSVITKDVPEKTLAIGRARQINKENYGQSQKESLSFIGAIKSSNDTTTTDQ